MQTLMDTASGAFYVTTVSSTYAFDLDLMIVRRRPDVHAHEVTAMRSDGEPIALLLLDDCTVGRPMVMIVDLKLPGIPWTLRASTEVTSIEPSTVGTRARGPLS